MKPLVFTEDAVRILDRIGVPETWLAEPEKDQTPLPVRISETTSGVYVFTDDNVSRYGNEASSQPRLLIIDRDRGNLFSAIPVNERRTAFDRCTRIALRSFDTRVTLNPAWKPYHHK